MAKLKPCPCGEKPKKLYITESGHSLKYAYASGYCCGKWEVEFRTESYLPDSQECRDLATDAWNSAGRAK